MHGSYRKPCPSGGASGAVGTRVSRPSVDSVGTIRPTARSTSLPSDPTTASVARTFVRAVLDEWHLAALEPDASLVASELVTNGHCHGGGSRWMRLSIKGDRLRIAVADRDRSRSPRRRTSSIDDDGGRGLAMVAAVADRWGTQKRRLRSGKIVWCELKI